MNLECHTRPDGSWALVPKDLTGVRSIDKAITKLLRSFKTVDAPLPQGPLLTPPSRESFREYRGGSDIGALDLGRRWIGNMASILGISEAEVSVALERAKKATYGGEKATSELTRGPAGSLRTDNPPARPEQVFGEPVSAADVQKLHDEANAKRQAEGAMDRRSTKDKCAGLKLGAAAPISDIQRAWDIDSANRRAAQTR